MASVLAVKPPVYFLLILACLSSLALRGVTARDPFLVTPDVDDAFLWFVVCFAPELLALGFFRRPCAMVVFLGVRVLVSTKRKEETGWLAKMVVEMG